MIRVTPEGKVLYRAEKTTPHRFPTPASTDLFGSAVRNFQRFDPLDFVAELTQHIPDARKHLGRSFGFYANKTRGVRAKANGAHGGTVDVDDQHTPRVTLARRRWAALIKQIWRVDPLICARCGAGMRVIAFIQPSQREVIEKILKHCGLWEERSRGPPPGEGAAPPEPDPGGLRSVSDLEFVDAAPPEPVWTPD